MKILFVCTGNTCRSPMAEAAARLLCKRAGISGIEFRSAGISAVDGAPASSGAIQAAHAVGAELDGFRSRRLTMELASDADLAVCMTASHLAAVRAMAPELPATLLAPSGIPDPFGGSAEGYRAAMESMLPWLEQLVNAFQKTSQLNNLI